MQPFLSLLASVLLSGVEGGEIYWGKEAKPHSRPYMALVRFYSDQDGHLKRCGGSLVQDNFVLTAAHCKGRNMTVTLGAHNIKKRENSQQVIPVLRAFPHQDYDAKKHINDIMLLKVLSSEKKKAQLTKTVKTIALPHPRDVVKPGRVCSVAGWGKTTGGKLSNTLQEVDLQVQREQKCKDLFKNYKNSIELCVGNPKSKKASGGGDSGGPFVCKGVAQGIVSYAYKHPEVLPRVFTRISSFVPWIHRTMKLSRDN
ncbi:mast cell protease 8-like [Talpa occidentalis]|uniref:mast cell protease 8-like n=1 Tax=Talpa occidentalis TaxID=50954 RepID=UPI00188E380E|nr:mast cell protease 8-like [Talpa occidentalis]